jgi:hypothetical protein
MPSRHAIGLAPFVTGLALLGTTAPDVARSGLTVPSAASLVGASAAVLLGAGILLGVGGLDPDRSDGAGGSRGVGVAVGAVAVLGFLGGLAFALV